jgi:hypothetical protein
VRTFGPDAASCEVLVYREGALSAFGHDLVLRVHAFEIGVEISPPAVRARFDPASLRVAAALRDGRPVPGVPSASDAQDIERTVREKVLRVERFPEIRFASSAVSRRGEEHDVRGVLTLCGTSREIAFTTRPDGERLAAEVWLHQPDFGIRPYSAFLGALRVKPDVLVRVAVPRTPPTRSPGSEDPGPRVVEASFASPYAFSATAFFAGFMLVSAPTAEPMNAPVTAKRPATAVTPSTIPKTIRARTRKVAWTGVPKIPPARSTPA